MTQQANGASPLPLVHIHAQPSHHTEAYILRTRPRLLASRAAPGAALESGEGKAELLAADGESYEAIVLLKEAERRHRMNHEPLSTDKRLSTTASQATGLVAILWRVVAEVFVPAEVLTDLRPPLAPTLKRP